ncbi:MAG TPA: hypothetical protein VFI30_00060 [Nocardioidaceae bacterium]|nr:hypothetical protein [Nocardioidaceae bacterium]
MTTSITGPAVVPIAFESRSALRRAEGALVVGALAAVALAAVELFATTTPDEGHFHYLGDYLLTASGIPYMLALLVLLTSLRTLQGRRDGRTGYIGSAIASVGAVVLTGIFGYGLIAATSSSLGPTYVLAALATVVGVIVFAVGSWRAGLLPRWLLVAWPVAWILGSALPFPGPWPLLLAALYVVMAVVLPRRAHFQ